MAGGAPQRGSCMCGACKFTATPAGEGANVCHCGMCRKWTAGMFIAVECGDSLKFDDTTHVGIYRASEWGERVFCKLCGSSLVWRMQDRSSSGVSINAFDDPGQFTLTNQWFIDNKPDNYALANKTKSFSEAETIALFTQEGAG